jgi:hypothetical protein
MFQPVFLRDTLSMQQLAATAVEYAVCTRRLQSAFSSNTPFAVSLLLVGGASFVECLNTARLTGLVTITTYGTHSLRITIDTSIWQHQSITLCCWRRAARIGTFVINNTWTRRFLAHFDRYDF